MRDQLPGISLAQPPDFRLFDSLRRSAINTAFVISTDHSAGTRYRAPFQRDQYPIRVLACLIWKAPSERHGRIDNNPGQNRRPSSTI